MASRARRSVAQAAAQVIETLEERLAFAFAQPLVDDVGAWTRPTTPFVLNEQIWFSAHHGVETALYRSNGTTAGTSSVSLPGFDSLRSPIVLNDQAFVLLDNNALGVTDGTAAGTRVLSTVVRAVSEPSSGSAWAVELDGKLYFRATAPGQNGERLFVSDGTVAGTRSVTDALAVGNIDYIAGVWNGSVYFTRHLPDGSYELARANEGSASVVTPLNTGATSVTASQLQPLNSTTAIMKMTTGQGSRLWRTDGTASGTLPIDTTVTPMGEVTVRNGVAYFFGREGYGPGGLYRTDGTRDGTYRLTDTALSLARLDGVSAYAEIAGDTVLIHPSGPATTDYIYAIQPDETITKSTSQLIARGDFRLEGSRIWLGGLSSYVALSDPTTPLATDLNLAGDSAPFASVDGKYLFIGLGSVDSASTPIIYSWDIDGPKTATIKGTVWNDADSDGIVEADEPPVSGISVRFTFTPQGGGNAFTRYPVLGADGSFTIDLIPAGTYSVALSGSTYSVETRPPMTITVGPGETLSGVQAVTGYRTRWIGYVYNDANGNGRRDSGENYLPGVTLSYDGVTPTTPSITSWVTNADGRYMILKAGEYHGTLAPVPPAGWRVTSPKSVSTGVLPTNYVGVVTGPDFGITSLPLPGSVRVQFRYDYNRNGSPDAGESTADGPALFAYADVDDDGIYDAGDEPGAILEPGGVLANVPAGAQKIRFIAPQGWTTSLPGNAIAIDVPPNATEYTTTFALSPLPQPGGVDLTGVVFHDVDFSGAYTPDVDRFRAGVAIWDDLDADNIFDIGEPVALSDIAGRYNFTDLPAGAHRLTVPSDEVCFAWPLTNFIAMSTSATNAGEQRDLLVYPAHDAVRLSGQVRLDVNDNGILDADDPVLSGFPVLITGNVTTQPDSQGRFVYLGSPGSYTPIPVLPLGYQMATPPVSVSLKAGQTKDDFVLLVDGPPSLTSISGTVYDDRNWNQVQDQGDVPLGAVYVYADLNQNNGWDAYEPGAFTDGLGKYQIVDLPPGTYQIRVTPNMSVQRLSPAGGMHTVPINGYPVTGKDIGLGLLGRTVSGTAFRDYDKDGVQDVPDLTLSGVRVWADLNSNGVYDSGIDRQATTMSDGRYTLPTALSHDTRFYIEPPAGFISLKGAEVLVPSAGITTAYTLNLPATNQTAQLNGQVYTDRDGNGSFNGLDWLESNRDVSLVNPVTGVTIATARTATIGTKGFRFLDVAPGTYRVVFRMTDEQTLQGGNGYLVTLRAGDVVNDLVFGHRPIDASFSGVVLDDTDHNYDGDTRLAGVRAYLDLNFNRLYDPGELTSVTDANGRFTIDGVRYDFDKGYHSYLVIECPHLYMPVRPTPYPLWVNGKPGTNDLGDFVFEKPERAFVSGYVYVDANTNGKRDPGESGIPYAEVGQSFFSTNFDGVVADHEGFFIWQDSHQSGDYQLRARMPSEWVGTDPKFGGFKSVTLAPGQHVDGIDFGWVPWQIAGALFEDRDADGQRDANEPVIADRTVFVDSNANGQPDPSEPTTVSAEDGSFAFANVGGGTFRIAQVLPVGWVAAPLSVQLDTGEARGALSFASRNAAVPASLSGTVWSDTDSDGTLESSETPLSNVTVFIDSNANGLLDSGETSTLSGVDGAYAFTDLSRGSYRIAVLAPTGTRSSMPADGYRSVTLDGLDIVGINFGIAPAIVTTTVTLQSESATLSGGTVKASNNAGFTGTGFADYAGQNSAVTYTLTRISAETAMFEFRYANGSTANRPLQILVNNVVVGTVACTPTGSWTTWKTVSLANVSLPSGSVSIKAIASTSAGGANVDSLTVTSAGTVTPPPVNPPPVDPPPATTDLVIQSESATMSGGTVKSTSNAGYTGTGFADYAGQGSAVTYTFSRTSAGTSSLVLRYANGSTLNRPLQVFVNNVLVGTVACAPTGSWTTWSNVTLASIALPAGTVSIKAVASTSNGGANVDSLTITGGGTVIVPPPPPPPTNTTGSISGVLFMDANKNGIFDGKDYYLSGKQVFLDLDGDNVWDANEKQVTSDASGKFSFTGLAAGTYKVRRVVPAGYKQTSPLLDIALTAGQNVSGLKIITVTV